MLSAARLLRRLGDAARRHIAERLRPGRSLALESNLRDALVESRRRYKDLVELSSDFCWETGRDGRFVFVSPRGAAGHEAADLVGRDPRAFLAAPEAAAAPSPFAARAPVAEIDLWFRRADGTVACLLTSAMPVVAADGTWCGARGICRDVTEARARDAALARAEVRERLLAHITRTVRDEIEPARMLEAAAAATAQAFGAAGCRILRIDEDGGAIPAASFGAAGAVPDGIAALLGREAAVERAATADAEAILCLATAYRGRVNGALVLVRAAPAGAWSADERALAGDVATQLGVAIAQINNQIRLETLSRTDGLTGLLNRRAFVAELAERLARHAGGAAVAPGALFYVDLDNFKPVNDVLGHQKGDEALKAVAGLLGDSTRAGDLVARLGGDEFALWLERTDEAAAAGRAEELLAAARMLAAYSGDPARPLGISIGIAVHDPACAETVDALTRRADAAMYEIKHNGKDGYAIAPAPGADTDAAAAAAPVPA